MDENEGTSGAVELSTIPVEMSTVAVDMSTDVVESQDFTSSFKTDTIFATREELLTWVRAVGKSLGMVIVIGRSDTGNYVYWTRLAEGTTVVKDIFWAHPDSIELLNTFPVVLLIDSTYKTNRYRYPLVEIVGVTSTEKTYSAAFAYVNWERMDNFAWVLEKLRGLFRKQHELPQVILTDRDTGMMNALAAIFPTSANLLCQFHIKKNVRAKARLIVKDQAIVNDIMSAFQSVVHAKTTEEYDLELGLFNDLAGPYPSFIQYVKTTWLDPFKEKFIDAWINKHMHLGNTTTNRVESAHSHLKQILRDSRGDLCKCWDGMQTMLRIQHSDLKMHFEHSLSRVKVHHLKKKIFDEIKGLVSSNAIDHILDEMQQTGSVSLNPSLCRCTLRTTHGLPCACELSRVMMDCTPIPLSMIHQHWQRLNFKIQTEVVDDELSLDIELEAIKRRFEASDHAGRVMMKAKARELAFPDTTSMCAPPDTIITGRMQRWKNLIIKSQPPHLLPCVDLSKDSDGSQC